MEITRIILEHYGYQVSWAPNGAQGLAKMRQDRPDLVLLDVMMSHVLDGLDMSREMRAEPELRDIPVIMVSSIIDSPHAGMFPTDEELPVDAWLSKPVQPEGLLEKVRQYLPE